MDVLKTAEDLIEKVTNVVITESLSLEQLVEVCLHQALDNVDILQGVNAGRSQDISDINDIFMVKPVKDLDLPQGPLAVGLMFERTYLLDCYLQNKHCYYCMLLRLCTLVLVSLS